MNDRGEAFLAGFFLLSFLTVSALFVGIIVSAARAPAWVPDPTIQSVANTDSGVVFLNSRTIIRASGDGRLLALELDDGSTLEVRTQKYSMNMIRRVKLQPENQ